MFISSEPNSGVLSDYVDDELSRDQGNLLMHDDQIFPKGFSDMFCKNQIKSNLNNYRNNYL